ncbi:MAG: purine-nucleoside phosphorylase [Planctomycetes bacterium]|nr:purine-nucleoside phosphorylase [Planctomycetota bacterium]
MTDLKSRIDEASAFIRSSSGVAPAVGVILGTGLGNFVSQISTAASIPYSDIPNFPETTVAAHEGRLIVGETSGVPIVAMEGRFHYYEGCPLADITLPVRVIKALGARVLVVSNAAGGINPLFSRGDVVLIEDHINLMGVNPLIGPNDDSLGPRFPDMSQPYSRRLIDLASTVALEKSIPLRKGVYAAMTGPCLETRAEYRMLKTLGADLIGMSTVPEVIVAVHAGLEVLGFSIVTDMCLPDALVPARIEDIIEAANTAEPMLTAVLLETVARL